MAGVFGGDFEDFYAGDGGALYGEGGFDRAGIVGIGNMEEVFVAGAAGGEIEGGGGGFYCDGLLTVVAFEEAHDGAGGEEVADAAGDLEHEGIGWRF